MQGRMVGTEGVEVKVEGPELDRRRAGGIMGGIYWCPKLTADLTGRKQDAGADTDDTLSPQSELACKLWGGWRARRSSSWSLGKAKAGQPASCLTISSCDNVTTAFIFTQVFSTRHQPPGLWVFICIHQFMTHRVTLRCV